MYPFKKHADSGLPVDFDNSTYFFAIMLAIFGVAFIILV
jgi:hypothetical protein